MAILATVTLRSTVVDPFAWKRYRWGLLQPPDVARLAIYIDILWAFLAIVPAGPDHFVAAAHPAADAAVPCRCTPRAELESLAPHPSPHSPSEPSALASEITRRAQQRGFYSRRATLQATGITSCTHRAFHLPTTPLAPFADLTPSPDVQLPSRVERLAEGCSPAAVCVGGPFRTLDLDNLNESVPWEPWFRLFRPHLDLLLHLVLALIAAGCHSLDSSGGRVPCAVPGWAATTVLGLDAAICAQGHFPGHSSRQHPGPRAPPPHRALSGHHSSVGHGTSRGGHRRQPHCPICPLQGLRATQRSQVLPASIRGVSDHRH